MSVNGKELNDMVKFFVSFFINGVEGIHKFTHTNMEADSIYSEYEEYIIDNLNLSGDESE